MLWLVTALALAKPTASEVVIPGMATQNTGPLASGRVTLTLDVAMAPVDGIPMSSVRSARADFVVQTQAGKSLTVTRVPDGVDGCRFRLPLKAAWVPDALVQIQVVLSGDPLPMAVRPHLPEGAQEKDGVWTLTAPKGDVVLDLPACS